MNGVNTESEREERVSECVFVCVCVGGGVVGEGGRY